MDLHALPGFELNLELEENQENDSSQEKTNDDVVENGSDTSDNSNDSPVYDEKADQLAVQTFNHLKERGILGDVDDFDGTWEKLEESLNTLPQRVVNSLIEEAPELSKQLVKFAFSSDNITVEDFKNFAKTYLTELESSNDEIETMDEAREYLENIYKERGLRPSAIRAALDALEEDDALIEEAKLEAEKNSQNKHAKTNQIIEQKSQEKVERERQQYQFVEQLSNELDQTGWTKARIDKVRQNLSGNKLNELLHSIATSPKALIKLADFVDYYDPKLKDIDYSKFMTKSESKAALAFKEKIETYANTPNSNTKSTLTNPNDDLDDLIPIVN